jgi:general secretion pathway protein J
MTTTRRPVDGDPRAGFTLLELLIAITLLGLLMAALFAGLQLGARAWERGEERLDQSARLQVVQGFLRDRLMQANPLDGVEDGTGRRRLTFEGTPEALRFVTVMPEHLGAGFTEFVLTLVDQDDARHLIVRWRPFEVSDPIPATADAGPQIKVLLEEIENLQLSYYGAPGRELPAAWYEQWLEASVMPELVRLRVSFAPGDPRYWPDLIVAPMTDAVPPTF